MKNLTFILFALILLVSCSDSSSPSSNQEKRDAICQDCSLKLVDDLPSPVVDKALKEFEKVACVDKDTLDTYLKAFENTFSYSTLEAKDGFCIYKIKYNTHFLNPLQNETASVQNAKVASGIITIPNNLTHQTHSIVYSRGDYALPLESAKLSKFNLNFFERFDSITISQLLNVISNTSISDDAMLPLILATSGLSADDLSFLMDHYNELILALPLMSQGVFIAADFEYPNIGSNNYPTCYDEFRFSSYLDSIDPFDCVRYLQDIISASYDLLSELNKHPSYNFMAFGFSAGAYSTVKLHDKLDTMFRIQPVPMPPAIIMSQASNGFYPKEAFELENAPLYIYHSQNDTRIPKTFAEEFLTTMQQAYPNNTSLIQLVDENPSSGHIDALFWSVSHFYNKAVDKNNQ